MHDRKDWQICIIDDDPSVQRGLRRLLTTHGFKPRIFSSAEEFFNLKISRRAIGCILLDINMPGMSGLDTQTALLERGIQLPVIFITGYGTVPNTVKAMKRGALDVLEKPFHDGKLMTVVEHAIAVSRKRAKENLERLEVLEKWASLTPRECQVFEHVVNGRLNREIARDLGIVEKTVKVHRARIMAKLDAKSITDLVRMDEKLNRNSHQY